MARELCHLGSLVEALGQEVPVLATVYSPLTIAHKLAGSALDRDIYEAPQMVLEALRAIALTTAEFVRQALAAGCAGVFFAAQDANPRRFSEEGYRRFGETFDRVVLDAASPGWFNILHMHGSSILFDCLKGYPVTALNWHIGEAEPSVAVYRREGGSRPIVGGLRRTGLTQRDAGSVSADLVAIGAETAGRGILLAPGCVIREPVDMKFLKSVAEQIEAGGGMP
jgi:uroporphyrinogen decarboxylase